MPLTRSAGRPTTTPAAAEINAAAAKLNGNGQPALPSDGFGVRADAEERGVAEREQAGVAGEQHQAEADDGVDQHEGELGEPVLGEQPRRREQRGDEQAVPERLPAVLDEADVLEVGRLEEEAHQTFLRSFSPNRPFGRTTSMIRTTT